MLNFEQVRLLETKIAKAIDYVERLNAEKIAAVRGEAELRDGIAALEKQGTELQDEIAALQLRNEELEGFLARFKDEQGQIEESVLSALDKLNRLEMDIESSKTEKPKVGSAEPPVPAPKEPVQEEHAPKEHAPEELVLDGEPAGVADPLLGVQGGETSSGEEGRELEIF